MQKIAVVLILTVFASCNYLSRNSIFITDTDYFEHSRKYSPGKSMLILDYSLDQGALGYGFGHTAVVRVADLSKNLLQFSLPQKLMKLEWVDDKTISARVDILPFVRSGEKPVINDLEINGVKVEVSAYDYIEANYHLAVEHLEVSPDGKLELVAYRYLEDRNSLNFIHISVINKGESIPKYGNYFIADMTSDRVLYATWSKENTLLFSSNSMDKDQIQYLLVHDRPNIRYEIIADDVKYGSEYRLTK